ncbi:3D domain-containing protein [Desulfosporosinus sp.]|uniref:3D domain-containing protein n=1 Tax=Desulfosporosinus sp. TaxID=157907 RepID=UPI0025C5F1A9|nr:3D domain-containing protein [Desulfosporosinus sp.]MBC2723512.1 3D domain-containing protein [Desulfosporosinus sp.]MBC2728645.1 3D domain-containing protein [Desulfosporosinus sp.]
MIVTAYTANDKGMDGKGITASGEHVLEGRTIAADPSFPFGTLIYIPKLDNTYTVTDRGGAICGDKLDLYMENRRDAIEFGVWELEVRIEKVEG